MIDGVYFRYLSNEGELRVCVCVGEEGIYVGEGNGEEVQGGRRCSHEIQTNKKKNTRLIKSLHDPSSTPTQSPCLRINRGEGGGTAAF